MEGFDYIKPVHYKLFLIPNLETFYFDGITEFDFELQEPRTKMSLHALDLSFKSVKRIADDGEEIELEYELDLEKEIVVITFDKELSGSQKLVMQYTGEHNENLHGFYRGKHKSPEGEIKDVVVTQFQANDARRAFPCVDIPGFKATFDIEFLVEKKYVTISNMPIKEEIKKDNGMKLVTFDQTPVMSTYLLFFGVGDFEMVQKEANGRLFRVFAHPPKAVNNGHFALDWGVKVVEYCENFFNVDYPLPKLDQIATPAFAAGAMENWGAILYRENALLHYGDKTSKSGENGILGVVAHEISHQWFGNLVSPKTWKWTWLNESFATFFAMKVVDHYYPERNMWEYYVASTNLGRRSRSTSGVMDWDSMIETSPIEISGDAVIAYSAKTVPILYSKGGAILRQVESYLGEDGFRAGLQAYFKKHAYSASESDYLWSALAEATGKPVNKMMESFILQKGLPQVTVSRDGAKFTLSQQRFTYLPYVSDSMWIVPASLKLFKNGQLVTEKMLVLDEMQKTFDLSDVDFDAYKFNSEMTGFYRTKYPDEDYAMLKELVVSKTITPIDRLVLEDELFAFLKSTQISLDTYLDFITAYKTENSHLSLLSIATHLRDIYTLLEGEMKGTIAGQASELLEMIFENIGYEPQDGENMGLSIIRGTLLTIAVELESEKAKDFALDQFNKLKNGDHISADIKGSIKAIAASLTNDKSWFDNEFANPESESDFISTITAMTRFSDKGLLEQVQEMIFTDIPNRNRGFAINSLCSNPVSGPEMFEFYLANLDSFESLNNFMYQGALVAVISTGLDRQEEFETFFKKYSSQNPNSSDAIDVGLEQLKIKLQFKEYLN